MNKDQKYFYKELVNKKVHLPCSRCNYTNFSFDGDFLLAGNRNADNFNINGPAIECVIITCENCGFVNLYATASLENNKQIETIETNKNKEEICFSFHHYCCRRIFIFLLVLVSIILYLR